MNPKISTALAALGLAVLLGGCGGDGEGDTTPPTVVSVTPIDGATGVARTTIVTIRFSEAIDLDTVTPTNVVWREAGAGGAAVAYTSSWDVPTSTLTLTLPPGAALANYRQHEVQVTTGVADPAGNALAAAHAFGFTTADDVPPGIPGDLADEGAYTQATVAFGWSAATDDGSGVAGYVLQVASMPDETVLGEVETPDLSATFDASTYEDGLELAARVAAVDAAGNAGDWSGWTDGVILDTTGPTVAGAVGDDGDNSLARTVHLAWAEGSDAGSGLASYTIEIATDPDYTPVTSATIATNAYDFTWDGAIPFPVYARVYATDAVGNVGPYSQWSNGITIRDDVPAAPAAPIDGGVYSAIATLTFSWSPPSTGVPDEYVLQVGTAPGASDAGEQTVAGATTSADVDVSAFPNGVTFFARVAARTGALTGAFSQSSDGIRVDTTPPGAPGTPVDQGEVDDRYVTLTWSAATDGESGIASYEVEVYVDATLVLSAGVTGTSYTFDADGYPDRIVTARVRALNGAGLAGPFSALSDGVRVDLSAPYRWSWSPEQGQTGIGTNVNVSISFSEPMDQESVEAAFALAWGAEHPAHGYLFLWGEDGTSVLVVPDTEDPPGATNVDLLPEATEIRLTLSSAATDLAGNALQNPLDLVFTTADETAPRLASLTADGHPSPVPPSAAQDGITLAATFDEDMSTTWSWVEIRLGESSVWGSGTWRPDQRTLEFSLDASLPPATELEVRIQAADTAGNFAYVETWLQIGQDPLRDAEPPRLVASFAESPVKGMQVLGFRFSEPLARSSLEGVTATAVDGDVYEIEYSSGEYGPVIAFQPLRSPPAGSTVRLRIPTSVTDLAGNELAEAIDVSYTVAEFTDLTAPVAGDTVPPADRPAWSWNVEIAFEDGESGYPDALDALSVGPEDVQVLDDATGLLVRGWRTETRRGSSILKLLPPPRGPYGPGSFTIRHALGESEGGTGIADAFGNPAAEGAFTAWVAEGPPEGPNRVPHAASLEEIRVGCSSSPVARRLEVRLPLADADGTFESPAPVTVSVTGKDGAVPFPDTEQTLGVWGWTEYRYGEDGGPPFATAPAELDDVNFPASGYYPFTITLDDGSDTTSYRRMAWVWAPSDVPAIQSIDDGGAIRPMSAARPPVIVNTASPTFRWGDQDAENADVLVTYVAETGAIGDGAGGYVEAVPLPPATTQLTAPNPLVPGVYLWTVAQTKLPRGSTDIMSTGWALDFNESAEAMFVYGPENDSLAGQAYGVATARLLQGRSEFDDLVLAGVDGERGTYEVEAMPAETAPVFVAHDLVDNAGGPVTDPDRLFARGTAGELMVTEPATVLPFPLPRHGFLRAAGDLFAAAQRNEAVPSITAGAHRFATSGFGPALPGLFTFVQFELSASGDPPVLGEIGASVGEVIDETGAGEVLTVNLTENTGGEVGPIYVDYSLDADGLLHIHYNPFEPVAGFASGYMGGTSGAEIVAAASDSTPGRVWWLLAGRARTWSGETVADLSGTYRFVDFAVRHSDDPLDADGLEESHGADGTLVFDGEGGFVYQVQTGGGTMVGSGTYAVDPASERVTVTVAGNTFLLAAGPDLDLLYGIAIGTEGFAELLVIGR